MTALALVICDWFQQAGRRCRRKAGLSTTRNRQGSRPSEEGASRPASST